MSDLIVPRTLRIAGIVTTAELIAAGWSGARIRSLCRHGDLYQVGRGAYADGKRAREMLAIADGKQLLQLAAAVAVTGPTGGGGQPRIRSVSSLDRPALNAG